MGFVLFVLFILLVAVGAVFLLGVWSTIRSTHNETMHTWETIKDSCQKRCDLVPNYINCCKVFLTNEAGAVENLKASNNQLREAIEKNDRNQVEKSLNLFEKSYSQVSELALKVPKLKAMKAHADLLNQLSKSYNNISGLVMKYNKQARSYNQYADRFPGTLFITYLPKYAKIKAFNLNGATADASQQKQSAAKPAGNTAKAS